MRVRQPFAKRHCLSQTPGYCWLAHELQPGNNLSAASTTQPVPRRRLLWNPLAFRSALSFGVLAPGKGAGTATGAEANAPQIEQAALL